MPYSYDDEEKKLRARLPLAEQKRITTLGPEGNMRPELVSGFPDVAPPSLTNPPVPFGQPQFAATPQTRPTPYAYGNQAGNQGKTGYKITDPLTGRERGFATEEEALAALQASTSRTPQALAGARNDVLQRAQQGAQATGGQIPQGAFNAQEQALAPALSQQSRLQVPQQRAQVTTSAQPYGGQAAHPLALAPLPQQQGTTIIRGTNVSQAGPLGEGNDPLALARQQLAANIRAGSEQGADLNRYLPALQAVDQKEKTLPTLSQAQGELLRTNPEKFMKTFPPEGQQGEYSFGKQLASTYQGEGEEETEIPGALPVINRGTGQVRYENPPSVNQAPSDAGAPAAPPPATKAPPPLVTGQESQQSALKAYMKAAAAANPDATSDEIIDFFYANHAKKYGL